MGECSPSLQSQPLSPFCSFLSFIIALDSLSLSHQPMGHHGIAMVSCLLIGVGFEWGLSGFVGPVLQKLNVLEPTTGVARDACDTVTIIDTPPMVVIGVMAYVNTPCGL
ncbi:60S ribosomal protein L3 [Tanacetum coccineum]